MNFHQFACQSLILLATLGCAAQNSGVKEVTQGWSFTLTNGSLRLSDSEGQSGEQLRSQIASVYSTVQSFQDPIVWSRHPTFFSEGWKSHLTISASQSAPVELHWVSSEELQTSLSFAHCSAQNSLSSLVPCEALALLNCLDLHAQSLESSKETANSGPDRSILLSGLKECGMSTALVSRTGTEFTFSIKGSEVRFSPSPVFSLLLFQGLWSSYEDANAQSSAVASISDSSCTRTDAACLKSPLDLSVCRGCEQLGKGQFYTVFFIENLRQNYDAVRSVPYIH